MTKKGGKGMPQQYMYRENKPFIFDMNEKTGHEKA